MYVKHKNKNAKNITNTTQPAPIPGFVTDAFKGPVLHSQIEKRDHSILRLASEIAMLGMGFHKQVQVA